MGQFDDAAHDVPHCHGTAPVNKGSACNNRALSAYQIDKPCNADARPSVACRDIPARCYELICMKTAQAVCKKYHPAIPGKIQPAVKNALADAHHNMNALSSSLPQDKSVVWLMCAGHLLGSSTPERNCFLEIFQAVAATVCAWKRQDATVIAQQTADPYQLTSAIIEQLGQGTSQDAGLPCYKVAPCSQSEQLDDHATSQQHDGSLAACLEQSAAGDKRHLNFSVNGIFHDASAGQSTATDAEYSASTGVTARRASQPVRKKLVARRQLHGSVTTPADTGFSFSTQIADGLSDDNGEHGHACPMYDHATLSLLDTIDGDLS